MSNKMTIAQAKNEAAKIAALIAGGAAMKEDGEMKRGEVYAKLAMEGTFNTEDKAQMAADALQFVQWTDPDKDANQLKGLSSYVRGFIKPEVLALKVDHRKVIGDFRKAVPASERPKRSLWQYATTLNAAIGKKKPGKVDMAFLKATFPKPLSKEEQDAARTPKEKRAAKEAALQEALNNFYAAALVLREHKGLGDAGNKARDMVITTFAPDTQ